VAEIAHLLCGRSLGLELLSRHTLIPCRSIGGLEGVLYLCVAGANRARQEDDPLWAGLGIQVAVAVLRAPVRAPAVSADKNTSGRRRSPARAGLIHRVVKPQECLLRHRGLGLLQKLVQAYEAPAILRPVDKLQKFPRLA